MNDSLIHPVILCGGSGTRLWPRSRATFPKPFLPLVGEQTLFEATATRSAPFAAPMVVTGAAHLAHVEAQLGDGVKAQIIVEPAQRNTAAASNAVVVLPDIPVPVSSTTNTRSASPSKARPRSRSGRGWRCGAWTACSHRWSPAKPRSPTSPTERSIRPSGPTPGCSGRSATARCCCRRPC